MNTKATTLSTITYWQANVNGVSVHVAEAGNKGNQTILFLHGFPENSRAFEGVMNELKGEYHLLAIDLPGIGGSDPIASSDKNAIAGFVHEFIQTLQLKQVILAGHDIGGMVVYAFLKQFSQQVLKAIIMNTAVPGVAPWEEVKRNPHIWHFAFFAVPSLPEVLTTGKEKPLFDFFYDNLSANKNAITESNRNYYAAAYKRPASLKTGFNWYRAFPQDEKDNTAGSRITTPVLYLRGEKEPGAGIEHYIAGFKESGLLNITHTSIPDCGHFTAEEQPVKVAKAIAEFVTSVPA